MTKLVINPKVKTLLQHLGLAEKEIEVYFGALRLGSTTIIKLANETGISRTGIYPIIQNLTIKGLMSTQLEGWKVRYIAENPSKLKSILDQKQAELTELMPEIQSYFTKPSPQNIIKAHSTKQDIKNAYLELLETKDPGDYLVMGSQDKWREFFGKTFTDEFIARRSRVGFDIKMIFEDSLVAINDQKTQAKYNQEIRIARKNFPFETNIVITETIILVHSLKDAGNLIKIQNEGMIGTMKTLFYQVWDSLEADI